MHLPPSHLISGEHCSPCISLPLPLLGFLIPSKGTQKYRQNKAPPCLRGCLANKVHSFEAASILLHKLCDNPLCIEKNKTVNREPFAAAKPHIAVTLSCCLDT